MTVSVLQAYLALGRGSPGQVIFSEEALASRRLDTGGMNRLAYRVIFSEEALASRRLDTGGMNRLAYGVIFSEEALASRRLGSATN